MSLVSLDTNILIWAIKKQASPGQEEMIPKANNLLERISRSNQRAMVSTIVVSELLMNVNPDSIPVMTSVIEKTFMVVPFDIQSAMMFARIWQEKNGAIEELKQSGIGRQQLKADCLIVASAIARKAICIYSNDKGLQKFAEGFIDVFGI